MSFDLTRRYAWRLATTVVALHDIILRPNRVEMVVGGISPREMYTLTHGETDFGDIVPVKSMEDRGVEVKHTLQAVIVIVSSNCSTCSAALTSTNRKWRWR